MFHPIGPKTRVQVVRIQFPQLGTTRVLGSGPHSSLAQLAELSTGCADRLGDKLGTDTGFGLLQETLCSLWGVGAGTFGREAEEENCALECSCKPGHPTHLPGSGKAWGSRESQGALCAWAQHGRKGLHWMGAPGHAG